jgi:hypothetical protein
VSSFKCRWSFDGFGPTPGASASGGGGWGMAAVGNCMGANQFDNVELARKSQTEVQSGDRWGGLGLCPEGTSENSPAFQQVSRRDS